MKIVLIQPPSGTPSLKVPPLGLGYITAVLKRNHIEAKIVDLSVENIDLSTYLSLEKPEIIGISSIATNARRALEIARTSKSILPTSFVVMGGPYPSMMRDLLVTRTGKLMRLLWARRNSPFLSSLNGYRMERV